MENTKKTLILLDGNAIIHRSFHALPPLTTKKGELVNAVYGFTSTLLSVIDQFKPDYVVATFDLAGPTFRHEQFTEYKATRTKAPDELYAQIPLVKKVVETFNIPIYEKAGYEADDVIGTISKKLAGQVQTIIVTGDMDTLQLVDDSTSVYTMSRGLSNAITYDAEKVFARYGINPNQLIDFKGLRGDPSDNIPGVKGIGEKTATTLLQKYQTVEGVYENIAEIKGTLKEKLEKDKAQALLSKDLATIDINSPITFELEKATLHDFDRSKIVELLSELNFYSLIKRLPKSDDEIENEKNLVPKNSSGKGVLETIYSLVEEKKTESFLKEIGGSKEVAISPELHLGAITGLSFSWKTGRASFVTFTEKSRLLLKTFLEDEKIAKIGFDLKSSYKMLNKYDIKLSPLSFDIMLADYVLDPGKKIDFKNLIFSEFGEDVFPEEQKKKQLSILDTEPTSEDVFENSCKRAAYVFKLKSSLEEKITKISQEQKAQKNQNTLETVMFDVEMPLVRILAEMEIQGIKIDTVIFKGISEKLTSRLTALEKSIHENAGSDFNINSPKQLAEVLFAKLNLPTFNIKKGKTGYSTASAELEKLRPENKIIEKIEEYRELFKLKTTYLDALPLLVDKNSHLHTTYNQAVAATGRLSSTEPNLQNIPIKTDIGQLMRAAFVAEDGFRFISADYSQIDLRCVAHVSGDKKMIEAFHRGDDIHRLTAAEVNKVTPSQVTEKMRSSAKALNFGIIYGMGAFGFSQSAGISRDEAQNFINTYMEKFSGVAKYMKETREFARKNGYVETLLGRRRNIPEINSPNMQVAAGAERMAINMPIQGLAADIMKLAMIKVHEHFKDDPAVRMILQIHDEIILEVKAGQEEKVGEKIKEIMQSAYPLSVPLIANIEIGDSWAEV